MAKFTKKAIVDTLLDLLEKKPLSHITVKEITEICEINHNTFYYYFSDIYQIVEEIFDEELSKLSEITFSNGSLADACAYALQLVLQHKKVILNLYNSVSHDQLIRYLRRVIEKVMSDFADRVFSGVSFSEEDRAFMLKYNSCAILGGILMWLEDEDDETLESVLHHFGGLTESSLIALMNNSAKIIADQQK